MTHVEIPVTRCKCNQIIGEMASNYQILKDSDMSHEEIIEQLGIDKICCLISIQSATTYPLKRARVGTASIAPKSFERDQNELRKVYRLESGIFKSEKESFNSLSVIETSSNTTFSKVEKKINKEDKESSEYRLATQKEIQKELFRKNPVSHMEFIKLNISKHPIEGIEDYTPDIYINSLEKGAVVSMGYVTDENGLPILIDVGEGYKVPILKSYFSLTN